jgi:integrase
MGSIVRHKDGWRAHVYVQGVRESKTFRTRREADSWAAGRESNLKSSGTSTTFGQAAQRWLDLKLPSLDNAVNQRTVEQSIRDYVLPALSSRPLGDIKRVELVKLVTAVAEAGKVETAHRLGQRIRDIFDLAVDSGEIESHPAADLSRVLPSRRRRCMPAVKPVELPKLMEDIHGYPEPMTRYGLLLLAHTFTRTTELIRARWEEIRDPETWVIPEERMKGQKERRLPHVVPLSEQVRFLLEDVRVLGEGSSYFLASEVNPMCGLSSNTLLYALYRLGYRGRMSGHGFRAVASSVLNESKLWHPDAIERQLHHGETDAVRAAYHRAEYLDERRKMMQWWSTYLESLAAKTAS